MGRIIPILLLGLFGLAACGAAITFPYKFYHLSPSSVWDYPGGQLVGAKGVRLSSKDCTPTIQNGKPVQKCVVVFYTELNKLVTDYKDTKQRLIDCEKGR